MLIFRDRVQVDEIPERKGKKGEFFPRLIGINVSNDGNAIEPIYMPAVRFQHRDGFMTIELNGRTRPFAIVTIDHRFPYLHCFRYDWLLIDEDEAEPWKAPTGARRSNIH